MRYRPALRRAASKGRDLARRVGLARYEPELWTASEWEQGYEGDRFEYFGGLDELPRYSILIGYLQHFASTGDILDVGCGQGLFRARIQHLPFRRYVGVDPTAAAVARAQAWADERTTFVVGDVVTAALPGPFDVVVLNEVLSVVPDPAAVIDKAAELARPDGVILTCNWRHPGDEHLWRLLDARLERVDRVDVQNPGNPIATRGWRMGCYRPHAGSATKPSPR